MPFREATGRTAAWRRSATALCAGLFAACLPMPPVVAQAPPDIQALADAAIRRLDLQTELVRQPEPLSWTLKLPPETIWLVVIIGLGLLLYAFRDMIPILRLSRSGAWTDEESGEADAASRAPEIVLGTADDLAAHGRFVEAMHTLLLQALAEIRRRLEEEFADSMTSREILRSKQLTDALRRPLREIVNRVEWTYFGEHPAARDDYLACRTSFSALAQALHGSAAA
jgi:hypothetical protein